MRILLVILLCCTPMLWAMKEEINTNNWKSVIEKAEEKLSILTAISLFCNDYIPKNSVVLDKNNEKSGLEQWNNKFDEFKKTLVEIQPIYSQWKKDFYSEKHKHNPFTIDSNNWILTCLKLKPYGDLDTVTNPEYEFLEKQKVLQELAKIATGPKRILLNKGTNPFFPLDFIQRTCPSDEKIMGMYNVQDISENYIEEFVSRISANDVDFLQEQINYFGMEQSDEAKKFIPFFMVKERGANLRHYLLDEDKFSKLEPEDQRKFVRSFYNLIAFFRGLMPNVFLLFNESTLSNRSTDPLPPDEIRKNENISVKIYPQVILIPGQSYLSYQKPYTILYGMLIQYAHIFLNENEDEYRKLLRERLNTLYHLNNSQIFSLTQLIVPSLPKWEKEKEKKKEKEIEEQKKNNKDNRPETGLFSQVFTWTKQGLTWIKSYIKPVLVTVGIVGTGTIAYKMWQARMKKKTE